VQEVFIACSGTSTASTRTKKFSNPGFYTKSRRNLAKNELPGTRSRGIRFVLFPDDQKALGRPTTGPYSSEDHQRPGPGTDLYRKRFPSRRPWTVA